MTNLFIRVAEKPRIFTTRRKVCCTLAARMHVAMRKNRRFSDRRGAAEAKRYKGFSSFVGHETPK